MKTVITAALLFSAGFIAVFSFGAGAVAPRSDAAATAGGGGYVGEGGQRPPLRSAIPQNVIQARLARASIAGRNATLGWAAHCTASEPFEMGVDARGWAFWSLACTDKATGGMTPPLRRRVVMIPADRDSGSVKSWDCAAAVDQTGHRCGVRF